jgi:xylan 1,4-beta-xylosidase
MKKFTLIFSICFFLSNLSLFAQKNTSITLSENNQNETLQMPWRNCIAVGRAQNLLRADCLEHLATAQKVMGYRYCRFHAIFDDDMAVVVRNPDSTLTFQWHQVDKVYDALLKIGIRPFVEINPMPTALASGTQLMFGYQMNVTPPKSYAEWSYFMEEFAKHLIQRYGLAEVRQWYFEVWNEPNLGAFFAGDKAEYFKLYSTTAIALKKVDNQFRVGGPASSNGKWVTDIINYCTTNKVPLDFVSTHLYAQDEQINYPNRKGSPYAIGDYFAAQVKGVQQEVKNSVRPDLELHYTEWNTQSAKDSSSVTWGDNIYVDNLYGASFIVRNCLELDKTVSSLAYWVISDIFDEGAIPHSPFSCTYGLMTIHGIPKATFNAFALLRKMDGNKLDVTKTEIPALNSFKKTKTSVASVVNVGSNRTSAYAVNDLGIIKIILWNQNFVEVPNNPTWSGSISIPFLDAKTNYVAISSTISGGSGSPWESWQAMGAPQNPTNLQFDLLRAHSIPAMAIESIKNMDGKICIDFSLLPGEVKYIEISPKGQVAVKRGISEADAKILNEQLSQKTKK